MEFIDKDLVSVQESRILLEHAREARELLSGYTGRKLDEVLEAVYAAATRHIREFAGWSAEETGYGCVEDETRQLENLPDALMKRLRTMKCIGVIDEDPLQGLKDIGVPLGVAVILCPAVSPVAAVLSTALICIKSGNAAVFIPDRRAAKTVTGVVAIIQRAAVSAGYPSGGISCLETVSPSGCQAAIGHDEVSVLINLGVKKLLPYCYAAGKPVLYGSTGPSPVFIERTADIARAAADIVTSRSFNCGMMPGAEQYVVVDSLVAGEAKQAMLAQGAYFMTGEEEEKLLSFLCPGGREMDEEYIGQPAVRLARQAGFTVPAETRILVSEKRYIADRNPYARELRCPVLAYYIEKDWMNACERCMNLLVQESKGHTLVIHSRDEEVIGQFAMKKPVARMLVNTPAVYGAMGLTTNLFPAAGLGGLTAGLGITADNISPLNLVYRRKVGYGIRSIEKPAASGSSNKAVRQLLSELIRELNNQ